MSILHSHWKLFQLLTWKLRYLCLMFCPLCVTSGYFVSVVFHVSKVIHFIWSPSHLQCGLSLKICSLNDITQRQEWNKTGRNGTFRAIWILSKTFTSPSAFCWCWGRVTGDGLILHGTYCLHLLYGLLELGMCTVCFWFSMTAVWIGTIDINSIFKRTLHVSSFPFYNITRFAKH